MKKKALKAISFLWVGSIAGAGCAFLAQVVLARVLGKSDFGVFAAALATVTLLVPIAGFGVAPFWLKAFGEEGWTARRWWPGSFRFVIASTCFVVMVLAFWAGVGPHSSPMPIILWLLLPYVLGQVVVELIGSKFQLEEKYLTLAVWQFMPHFCRLVLVTLSAWFFSFKFGVYFAALAYSVVTIIVFSIGAMLLRAMRKGWFSLQGHSGGSAIINESFSTKPSGLKVAAEAWPFGAAGLFHLVFFQSAVIVLQYLDGAEAAGIYSVAFLPMTAVYLFPSVIYQKFLLPKLHRWANHDHSALVESYRRGNLYMLGFGVIAMLLLLGNSWWVVPLVFGEEYSSAVVVLNVLALAIPMRYVASSIGSVLVTKDNMKLKVWYMGAAAVFNVGLNVLLIPVFGVLGAALVAVLSDVLLLLMYFYAVRKHVFGPSSY